MVSIKKIVSAVVALAMIGGTVIAASAANPRNYTGNTNSAYDNFTIFMGSYEDGGYTSNGWMSYTYDKDWIDEFQLTAYAYCSGQSKMGFVFFSEKESGYQRDCTRSINTDKKSDKTYVKSPQWDIANTTYLRCDFKPYIGSDQIGKLTRRISTDITDS
ncbi:MAG: hypothetical protein QM689_08020 [Oscillospiraceae bacterium]